MKASRYNVFVDYSPDNVIIAYNCVSGGMIVFEKEKMRIVDAWLAASIQSPSKDEMEVRDKLIENRFLLEEDMDEMQLLKMRNSLARFNPNDLGLVLTPALSCNLRCPYCYVDRQKIFMERETIAALKKFVEKKIAGINTFLLSWTGGEPLLALDTVEELNSFFQDLCIKNKKASSITLITNGLLLGAEYVNRLKKCGIHTVQVTLDGTADFHNRYRVTVGGRKTYRTILENIVNATKGQLKVILRTNIDKSNYEDIYRLIDEVAESGVDLKYIVFSPCRVSIMETSTESVINCEPFSKEEFARLEPKLLLYAMKKGFGFNPKRLAAQHSYCGANTLPLHVIDAYGNILKCWCNLGRAEGNMVGKLKADGTIEYNNIQQLSRWLCWDPFDIPECKNCNVLPLCMGGCMYYNLMGQSTDIKSGCTELKYNLEAILKLSYLSAVKTPHQLSNIDDV